MPAGVIHRTRKTEPAELQSHLSWGPAKKAGEVFGGSYDGEHCVTKKKLCVSNDLLQGYLNKVCVSFCVRIAIHSLADIYPKMQQIAKRG